LWIIPPFEPEPEPSAKSVDTTSSTTTTGNTQPPTTTSGGPTKRTTGKLNQPEAKPIRKLRIKGDIDLSNWADVFRSFVSPAARMGLKRLRLSIDFELEDKPLDANDPAVKAMKESARQLGVNVEEE
ncbi:MAG: hypothetical protein J0653_05450, partial [Deltaproteobacteria bacterium]|nr:hypothetical protein [Deltaproteobacteria bacterium]